MKRLATLFIMGRALRGWLQIASTHRKRYFNNISCDRNKTVVM